VGDNCSPAEGFKVMPEDNMDELAEFFNITIKWILILLVCIATAAAMFSVANVYLNGEPKQKIERINT